MAPPWSPLSARMMPRLFQAPAFAGTFATTSLQNVYALPYTRVRRAVRNPRARASTATEMGSRRRPSTALSASTASITTAASERYILCSAMISVETGITLELGARMTKNQAPTNPMGEFRRRSAHVAAARERTIPAQRATSSGLPSRIRP